MTLHFQGFHKCLLPGLSKRDLFFSLLLHLPVCKFPLGRETCNSQQFRANKWTDERLNKHTGINRNRECYKHVWKSVVQSDEVSWLSDHNTETGTSTACWSLQVFIRSACVGAGTVWHAFLFHVLLKKCLRRRPLHKLFSHIDQFVNHIFRQKTCCGHQWKCRCACLSPVLLPSSSCVDTQWRPAGGIVCEPHRYTLEKQPQCHTCVFMSKLCFQKTGGRRKRSSHLGTGSPVFQKHPCKQRQTPSDPAYSPHRCVRAAGIRLSHQMNSLQWKQKVGCRRKVDMNLCPLTWWILRLTAPFRFLVNSL